MSSSTNSSGSDAEYIDDWDRYFLWLAMTVSRKSKDQKCRVGAVIASEDCIVLATGFNGLARGVYDEVRLLSDGDEKLNWICHAEANAIFNAARIGVSLKGASIFVTKFPCIGCCNAIVQAGLKRIYTHDHRFWNGDRPDPDHSRKKSILRQARIEVDAPFHPEFAPQSLRPMATIAGRRSAKKKPSKQIILPPDDDLFTNRK